MVWGIGERIGVKDKFERMRIHLTLLLAGVCAMGFAQGTDLGRLGRGMRLEIESTTNVGGGDFAPLWLSSNRYGLSSTEKTWNYERVGFHRDMANDSTRRWKMGYGADIAVMFGGERTFCLQEAFFEFGYRKVYATLGCKKQELPMKNALLSSGGFIYGINSRPIPQIRIGAEYFNFPWTKGWWQWKGHLSYGWKTDGGWQKSYLEKKGLLQEPLTQKARRTEGTLYHEKALYWKFGKMETFPLEFEIGLQWVTEFGGTAYNFTTRGYNIEQTKNGVKLPGDFKAYWHALIPGGVGAGDGDRPNIEGNHLGSWNLALTFRKYGWLGRVYFERMFEDYSQLGTRYGISDHLLGFEVGFPQNPFVSGLVLEHINTREQSGAVFHDVTKYIPDQMDGRDNYYNHTYYTGYQHYGMTMGNPLITAPLYNKALGRDGEIFFYNNRVRAWHIGISGNPVEGLDWRVLMTFSKNWGTYPQAFEDPKNQTYLMLEAKYGPASWKGWSGKIALGLDRGDLIGNNTGCQFTVVKNFNL